MTIAIELNGETREVGDGDCVQDLIDALALTNQALAIAVNREVVARAKWRERRFAAGDKVDIVRAIGGG
ncbi:MAG: sulfur carrier protein ThiS [Burkholderiaceae bacterium]|nr:sulfur carrier protein ThiS [Burkholderiaceae bacterium]